MAGRFTNGQKVRVPDSLASAPNRVFSDYAGKVGVATGETGAYYTDYDRADFGPPLGVGLFGEGELELVIEPNWAQVEAGDRVTFTNSLGETVGPVTATGGTDPDDIFVLGRRTTQWGIYGTLSLIEKPAPALPTTPGSVIRSANHRDLAFLTHQMWIDQDGDERNPYSWVGWTLVHDEGANQ